MCIALVKIPAIKYESTLFSKDKVYSSIKYDGLVYNATEKYNYFPCGKCFECKEYYIEQWQIRWNEELKNTEEHTTKFITLTYSNENLPYLITPDGEIKSTLCYRDVQLFLKRLRKKQNTKFKNNGLSIKYHGSGEYGKRFTKRPHYHILLTNVLLDDKEITQCWGNGIVHFGNTVNKDTVKYILKYTIKESLKNNSKVKNFDENDNYINTTYCINTENEYRVAEKSFMSKNIGLSFLTDDLIKYYRNTLSIKYNWINYNGKGLTKVKLLPRYYREKLYNPVQKDYYGKIMYNDNGTALKTYRLTLPEEYVINKITFKYRVKMFEDNKLKQIEIQKEVQKYNNVDEFIEAKRQQKIDKIIKYVNQQKKLEKLQLSKNGITDLI